MKLVRRAHLYAGLFMTPWVFLYGVTALLFNHPLAFPDQDVRSIAPADLAGTALADFPRPQALAERVVAAINADAGEEAPAYRLVRPTEAAYARDYFTTLSGGGKDHLVRLDLATGAGTVRSSPRRKDAERESPAPFARRAGLRLDPSPMDALTKSLPAVLARLNLPTDGPAGAPETEGGRGEGRAGGRERGVGGPGGGRGRGGQGAEAAPLEGGPGGPGGGRGAAGRVAPELNFVMEGQGKVWRVGYNLQTGALTGRLADAPRAGEPLSTRRFLTRLHLAHGYSSRFDSRWIWALSVDLMFVSMVGWGVTGLLMWWQMKNLRRVGLVVLVLSAVVATAVAVGMHGAIAGGP